MHLGTAILGKPSTELEKVIRSNAVVEEFLVINIESPELNKTKEVVTHESYQDAVLEDATEKLPTKSPDHGLEEFEQV